jgi:hypothetical protein
MATMLTILYRFAKLKNDEFNWWMTTLEAIIPEAKERLTMFDEIANNLKTYGEIKDVERLTIECDERWITKKKSVLLHSLKEFDDAIRESSERATLTMAKQGKNNKKRSLPTVGEKDNSSKKPRSLGMLALRRTPMKN